VAKPNPERAAVPRRESQTTALCAHPLLQEVKKGIFAQMFTHSRNSGVSELKTRQSNSGSIT
jgi:hypothetical protein